MNDSEKELIQEYLENSRLELESNIVKERKKMENFEYSEEKLKKQKIIEINLEELKSCDQDSLILNYFEQKKEIKNKQNNYNNNSDLLKQEKVQEKVKIANSTVKKEELVEFIYDITTQNLTASSFKFAFRNFKNNDDEKEAYLLVKYIINKY